LGLAKKGEEAEVDEKLGTYLECLGPRNRKLWRIEELHLRQELGIKTLDDNTLSELKSQKPHNKLIKTTFNYEI